MDESAETSQHQQQQQPKPKTRLSFLKKFIAKFQPVKSLDESPQEQHYQQNGLYLRKTHSLPYRHVRAPPNRVNRYMSVNNRNFEREKRMIREEDHHINADFIAEEENIVRMNQQAVLEQHQSSVNFYIQQMQESFKMHVEQQQRTLEDHVRLQQRSLHDNILEQQRCFDTQLSNGNSMGSNSSVTSYRGRQPYRKKHDYMNKQQK